jgi:hypothetical protein
MVTLTLAYSAIARNRSPADLEAALLALPLDTDLTTLNGMTLSSDTASIAGNLVTRTIVYTTAPPSPAIPIPDANIGDMAIGWYTVAFAKALATPIVAAIPVVS